jgi:hypothetical protein
MSKADARAANALLRKVLMRFNSDDLVDIADELELPEDVEEDGAIVQAVLDDYDEQGLPDWEMSEELFDLLVLLGKMDEDGNDTAEAEEADAADDVALPDELPDCFGYADTSDTACKKCSIKKPCYAERVANRPECYGKAYAEKSPECSVCLEWKDCQKALPI